MNFKRALDKLFDREVIGHPDCPLMIRWTFLDLSETRLARWLPILFNYKAMVHYFPPEVDDKDPHDHPRSFLTFVLSGGYMDQHWPEGGGDPEIEIVAAPAIRLRRAEHMHIVETMPGTGCWTVVVMGPPKRAWGFLRLDSNKWWPWERYVQKFGGTVRCETDDGDRSHELEKSPKRTAADYKTPWDHLG